VYYIQVMKAARKEEYSKSKEERLALIDVNVS
jgi:hypothetical protein